MQKRFAWLIDTPRWSICVFQTCVPSVLLRVPASCGLLLAVMLLPACQSPLLIFSGRAISGIERPSENWRVLDGYNLIQLETRPESPYSVIIRVTRIDGDVYIDAAPSRRWGEYLKADPRVRIKAGKHIYRALAELVDDPPITSGFTANRDVYRLIPGGW